MQAIWQYKLLFCFNVNINLLKINFDIIHYSSKNNVIIYFTVFYQYINHYGLVNFY